VTIPEAVFFSERGTKLLCKGDMAVTQYSFLATMCFLVTGTTIMIFYLLLPPFHITCRFGFSRRIKTTSNGKEEPKQQVI
jgi:hypothetical protein